MILAHINGLLTCCKVLARNGDRVRVKVLDEKRPKWVDLADGRRRLFDDTDQATQWIDGANQ